jgi:sugar lactone lactonase YvrE
MDQFGLANGLFFDRDGNLWVADSANNRLMRFPVELP